MKKSTRFLHEISELISRRYGKGDELLEAFLDLEACNAIETLMSYGPEECGGTECSTWQEYVAAAGKMSLANAAMGALVHFQRICRTIGIDYNKAFECFSESYGYWGSDEQISDVLQRVEQNARQYLKDGSREMSRIRRRNGA